jgi:hypothetical protein
MERARQIDALWQVWDLEGMVRAGLIDRDLEREARAELDAECTQTSQVDETSHYRTEV